MNLQEFAALKVGDKIENIYTSSVGKVSNVDPSGVRVKWSEHSPTFFYSVSSTAWMHWNKLPSRDAE